MISGAALADLKSRNPCAQVAAKWVRLRKAGRKMIGPCPICSENRQSKTATRFEVLPSDAWVCAVCADGGDVIALIQKVEGKSFLEAVDWLGGAQEIDPQEARRRADEAKRKKEKADRDSAIYRERERKRLWAMWQAALHIDATPVMTYLAQRGVMAPPRARLRYLVDAALFGTSAPSSVQEDSSARAPAPIHKGPCMLAAIVDNAGIFRGLHFTWIDLAQPKGKALVADPATGALVPAKKVRGSKSGGHIDLMPCEAPKRLIIGEGIEKVAAVYSASSYLARIETSYWSSVDLGNLGGKARCSVDHPQLKTDNGRPRRVPGPEPDLESHAIKIPDSVAEVIILGDSTSDRFLTECAVQRAAKRWARPGRVIRVAWAPEDGDFDDLLRCAQPSSSIGRDDCPIQGKTRGLDDGFDACPSSRQSTEGISA